MTRKKRSLSNDDLRTVAVACGGVALLMAIAVFLAPQNIVVSATPSNSNVAAAGDFRDHDTNANCAPQAQKTNPKDPPRMADHHSDADKSVDADCRSILKLR
jgi:hypothetical protein